MYNAMIMKVCNCRQGGPDELRRIALKVVSLAANAVKQFTT